MRFGVILFFLTSFSFAADALKPGSKDLGTKEDRSLIVTLGLWYAEIRNTVSDAYNTIQYTRAMIDNLDRMKQWYKNNKRQWKDVGNKMVKLVEEPGRWDKKLIEVEKLFDAMDHQFFDETAKLDDLMYRGEKYSKGAWEGGVDITRPSHPRTKEFMREMRMLYGKSPDKIIIPRHLEGYPAAIEILKEMKREERRKRDEVTKNWYVGRVAQSTRLAASSALSRVAAIKQMQKNRAGRLDKLSKLLKDKNSLNTSAMKESLKSLFTVSNELDMVSMNIIEMELMYQELGMEIYDMTTLRKEQLRTLDSYEQLAKNLKSVKFIDPYAGTAIRRNFNSALKTK